MTSRRFLLSLLILTVCLPHIAQACPICRMPMGFSVSHPHAIRIALSIRAALDRQLLKENDERAAAVRFVTSRRVVAALARSEISIEQALRYGILETETPEEQAPQRREHR